MELALFIGSIAVMIGAGYAVLGILTVRSPIRFTVSESLALSFGLGMGCVAVELLIFALLGEKLDLVYMVAPWAIAAAIMFFLSRKDYDPGLSRDRLDLRANPVRFMLSVLCVQMGSIFLRALSKPVESYDAIINFAIKSKIMFLDNGLDLSGAVFEGIGKGHQDYPLLIPMIETWAYKFMGAHNDLLVKAVFPLVLLAFMVTVYSVIKRMFDARYGLLFAFLLGTMPQIVNYSTIAYADLTFTFMVTASFLMLLEYYRLEEKSFLVLSSVFLGIGMLTKNEGIAFLLSTAGILFLSVITSKRRWREAGRVLLYFLLPLAIVVAPWITFKYELGAHNTDIELSKMTLERLLENAKQIPFILNKFQQELFQPKKWNIFWIMVIGFSVLRYKRIANPLIQKTLIFLIFNLAIYFASNMVITGKDLFFHVNTTMSRFMIHFSGIALVYLALLVREDVKRIPFFGEEEEVSV